MAFTKPLTAPSNEFDIKKANQELDHISLTLSIQHLEVEPLETAISTLTQLVSKAEDCVDDAQKKINDLDVLITQAGTSKDNKIEGEDLIYLNKQHKEFSDEQAKCRLFAIRTKEHIEDYKTDIAKLKQVETFTRNKPLWTLVKKTIDSPPETKLTNLLTVKLPALLPSALISVISIGLASIFATSTLLIFSKTRFALHYLRFKKLTISSVLLLTTVILTGSLFVYLLAHEKDLSTPDLPLILSGILFSYLTLLEFLSFLFHTKRIMAIFYWYALDSSFVYALISVFLGFYTVTLIGQQLSDLFSVNSPLKQIYQSLFLLIILATTMHFIYKFCKTHNHFTFIKKHNTFINHLSALVLLTCAIINFLGYYTLTQHLITSGFITLAILSITTLLSIDINKIYLSLSQQPRFRFIIIQYFGYKKEQKFVEFLILKIVIQLIIISLGVYLIGESWSFATGYVEDLFDQLLYGIRMANITIYPTRIVTGLVVFCLLFLMFRALSTNIIKHQQFEPEEEKQVAVASILTYIGFAFALLCGLLIAGFDFTGLAIIAGALSVGIGLGLQSIVNNFVSGLILLIEKPIRPGDRINVDGIEGFVKKIRVRSTHIITPSREDIIVPNSDLITRRVTNYMFSDKFCKINCEVGVAYGSDTLLVRDVLLDVANAHEEVIKTSRNKPIVLFQSFGDSTLNFQLWCLIKDVNNKFTVASELNFAIDKAFGENNIMMAFPQRDMNLKLESLDLIKKSWEELSKKNK
jgi:small-conductance mechanosensitive channel